MTTPPTGCMKILGNTTRRSRRTDITVASNWFSVPPRKIRSLLEAIRTCYRCSGRASRRRAHWRYATNESPGNVRRSGYHRKMVLLRYHRVFMVLRKYLHFPTIDRRKIRLKNAFLLRPNISSWDLHRRRSWESVSSVHSQHRACSFSSVLLPNLLNHSSHCTYAADGTFLFRKGVLMPQQIESRMNYRLNVDYALRKLLSTKTQIDPMSYPILHADIPPFVYGTCK